MSAESFFELLPDDVLARSGSVFYSGRSAFAAPRRLYALGLHPGGSPEAQAAETVRAHVAAWRSRPSERWSESVDESWAGRPPGTYKMQPQVCHLLGRLGMDPREVPSGNVVFVRSHSEADLAHERDALLAACWPVHRAVIDALGVDTILCFGATVAEWVRQQVGATQQVAQWFEHNRRRWQASVHACPSGLHVVQVPHPSRATWTTPAADPTELVAATLAREFGSFAV